MKNRIHTIVSTAILLGFASLFGAVVQAQPTSAQQAAYQKFVDNHRTNPEVAYQAAQDYLKQYGPSAAPDDKVVSYLRQWVVSYDRAQQIRKLLAHVDAKQADEAFTLGRTLLASDPDDLPVLTALTGAGWEDHTTGGTKHRQATLAHARNAIRLLEAGKSFSASEPLTAEQRNDTLGWLKFVIGWMLQRSAPSEAIDYLMDSMRRSEKIKLSPDPYHALAKIYEEYFYAPTAASYQEVCQLPEQAKAQACIDMKARIEAAADRAIDAWARAIAYSNDPKYKVELSERPRWEKRLETLYKDRNNGSVAGLQEMINGITSKPLMDRIKQ